MPIYVGYTQKRRAVRLLTAGEPQFLICPKLKTPDSPPNTDIDLLAAINDMTNVFNHTFTWEQIEGPPAVLTSYNTLSTTFTFSDTEDKVFRFYLDKDTNREQFKDVNLFYTPTSILGTTSAFQEKTDKFVTVPNLAKEDAVIPLGVTGIGGNVGSSKGTLFTTDTISAYGTSTFIAKLEVLTDSGYTHTPETVLETHYPPNLPTEYTLPNGVYKIRVYYDLPSGLKVYTSPLMVANNISDENVCVNNDLVANFGFSSKSSNIGRVSIKLFLAGTDPSGNFGIKPVLSRILRATPNSITLSDDTLHTFGVAPHIVSVARLDPSNIGNN